MDEYVKRIEDFEDTIYELFNRELIYLQLYHYDEGFVIFEYSTVFQLQDFIQDANTCIDLLPYDLFTYIQENHIGSISKLEELFQEDQQILADLEELKDNLKDGWVYFFNNNKINLDNIEGLYDYGGKQLYFSDFAECVNDIFGIELVDETIIKNYSGVGGDRLRLRVIAEEDNVEKIINLADKILSTS